MQCKNCGSAVSDDVFCGECGYSLKSEHEKSDYPVSEKNVDKYRLIAIITSIAALISVVAICAYSVMMVNTKSESKSSAPEPLKSSQTEKMPVKESQYEIVVKHISWQAANRAAEAAGGHLVTFQSADEFNKVTAMFSSSQYDNVKNVWIGACVPSSIATSESAMDYWNSYRAEWVTGEPFNYTKWRHGEPSGYDPNINEPERYLQMFRPKADNGAWSYNDAGNDLSEYKPNTLAYVIEYEYE